MSASERVEGAAAGAASGAFKICVMLYELVVSGCTLFGSCIKRCPAPVVSMMLRVLNLGNAVLLGAVCYFAFQTITGGDVTRTFLAIYCGLFGLLLALVRAVEAAWLEGACAGRDCPQHTALLLPPPPPPHHHPQPLTHALVLLPPRAV